MNKKQPSPPVTPRLGKRCWGLPIFNECGEKIHKIYSKNALRLSLKGYIINQLYYKSDCVKFEPFYNLLQKT